MDGAVFNTIQRQLFKISKIEGPSAGGIDVIKGNTFVSKEAGVVRRNWGLDTSRKHVADWMRSQVFGVS